MALEIKKSTQLIGNFKIGDEIVKTATVNVDDKGISTYSEYISRPELYSSNRKEMRAQEKEFREKRYELEDSILSELGEES